MSRIRTVKPDFFKHEGLYDAEKETGLPLRVAFAGLWTVCDREGRFRWRPRSMKTDILPYDEVDFSRVLDALSTRGFIVRYAHKGETFGHIPSWHVHQIINNREAKSVLPDPSESIAQTDASATREPRVTEMHVHAQGEGKGRERKGREGGADADASPPVDFSDDGADPNGSDEDRFWHLVGELKSKGIARSQAGQLAKVLNGDFERGLSILADTAGAKGSASAYLAKIIKNIQQENSPVAMRQVGSDLPVWLLEARAEGAVITREGERWRWAGALYDEKGEQVGM